ncbi:glycosyltransferase family 4 protein [Caballeronia insecticola]|uniref:Glycosyl transferase group 1 n=1 Tax=Caballeronia insecticola TaxID=758793 RepID=R4WYE6_9BURK|nr:glycosyltransferase family 4 protein [Caballeronia insecticola]BAN26495.1 glycosyl transferase group 1 [Caballeronia insecticola]
MKIGILTHIQHPIIEPFAGGLESFTYDLTQSLKRRGHDVTLFAHPGSALELHVTPLRAVGVHRSDVSRHEHDTLSTAFIAEHHAYLGLMQAIDGYRFDVIFNNALHYVPVTLASMIDTPMLTVLHTPPFFEIINAVAASKAHGGAYCTVSQANAANWSDLAPDCFVIPNGIDLNRWRPAIGPISDHAIWTGRLVPDKGLHFAIDAARLAGIPLRIAGQALDPTYFDKQIAPRLGGSIVYLGHLSRAALIDEVSHASVALVTPCWSEPFGLVAVEALATGTPIAAFARGAMPELVTPETGRLAAPDDVGALARAIIEARKLSRAACRLRAVENWGLELMTSRYEALLSEVASRVPVYD